MPVVDIISNSYHEVALCAFVLCDITVGIAMSAFWEVRRNMTQSWGLWAVPADSLLANLQGTYKVAVTGSELRWIPRLGDCGDMKHNTSCLQAYKSSWGRMGLVRNTRTPGTSPLVCLGLHCLPRAWLFYPWMSPLSIQPTYPSTSPGVSTLCIFSGMSFLGRLYYYNWFWRIWLLVQ